MCGGFDVGGIGDCGVRGTLSCGDRGCGDCLQGGPILVGDASSSSLKLAPLSRSIRVNEARFSGLLSVSLSFHPPCKTVWSTVE